VPIQFGHGTMRKQNININERERMTQLTQEEYETLDDCLGSFGEIARYSGRAMYGGECLGIIADNEERALFNLGIALMDDVTPETKSLVKILTRAEFRSDNMGRDSAVVYFPSIQLPDGVLAEDDEDEE